MCKKTLIDRFYLHLTIALISITGVHPLSPARTILVPRDYASIQKALDAAADGDSVVVSAGIYHELLMWPNKQGIKLVAPHGAAATFLQNPGDTGVCIDMRHHSDSSTVIAGFTVAGGFVAET
ncbi:MAG: hypothetical protein JW795_13265 [Chitinivibrionales bacterium]|nr:hypothetical protein [Chitinivibrionales bacterium]